MWKSHNEPPSIPKDCRNCAIREATLCGALRSDQLDILQEFKSCDRIVPAHSHLYRAGERLNEIYNLLSGWVALYRILESGRRQILQIELPGAFLGYQARIDEPMLHSAECITDVAVCVFPRRAFPDLLDRHPVLGLKLAGIMAQDVVRTHDQLTNVGGRSGMERVAHFLLQLYLRLRHRQPALGGDSLALPLTQEMIGDALGLTPVHINRILRQLRERRLVVLHNKTLQVLDLEGLRRMAEVPQLDPAEL
ncbi:Crp/Fnr family transcriptional regulator [Hypericibacter adhaerens]|jgi:CRP-like cAMP-binding protein|uniref:Crp/Fnr family transcriptional regulator n=1 Tax=Hypericibacter adhaerens TaxID=2602016 RepID=A0A5J6MWB1_9PROT|nr:Crp/Fnr family transcriptional regulator [Hypericibacter adhaerens]